MKRLKARPWAPGDARRRPTQELIREAISEHITREVAPLPSEQEAVAH